MFGSSNSYGKLFNALVYEGSSGCYPMFVLGIVPLIFAFLVLRVAMTVQRNVGSKGTMLWRPQSHSDAWKDLKSAWAGRSLTRTWVHAGKLCRLDIGLVALLALLVCWLSHDLSVCLTALHCDCDACLVCLVTLLVCWYPGLPACRSLWIGSWSLWIGSCQVLVPEEAHDRLISAAFRRQRQD